MGMGPTSPNAAGPPKGLAISRHTAAILEMARQALPGSTVAGVGHRVVHGGTLFAAPVQIDGHIIGELEKLCPLAPLHQPHNLAPIKAIAEKMPSIRQVACFDTSFHQAHRIWPKPLPFRANFLRRGSVAMAFTAFPTNM